MHCWIPRCSTIPSWNPIHKSVLMCQMNFCFSPFCSLIFFEAEIPHQIEIHNDAFVFVTHVCERLLISENFMSSRSSVENCLPNRRRLRTSIVKLDLRERLRMMFCTNSYTEGISAVTFFLETCSVTIFFTLFSFVSQCTRVCSELCRNRVWASSWVYIAKPFLQ